MFSAFWSGSDGPGIPKDAPQKTGLALFGDILKRESWELFKLNLMVVVTSLPIVTIPAARSAQASVCMAMVEDRNHYLWLDFWESFRHSFWRATATGWIVYLAMMVAGYVAYLYAQAAMHLAPYYIAPMGVAAAVLVFLLVMNCHLYPLLTFKRLSVREALSLSAQAALINSRAGLLAVTADVVIWGVTMMFYPMSSFLILGLNFAFCGLVAAFVAHDVAEQLTGGLLEKTTA